VRVLSILVRTGVEPKYGDAEGRVREMFSRQMPEVDHELVVVDNALPREHVERAPGRTLIGGDNDFREFSAWDRALTWLGAVAGAYDLVHLVTSAFHTLYVAYLDRIDTRLLRVIAGRPACLGHVDCYNRPIRFAAWQSQHWARSSFLFLPPLELRLLGSLVTVRDASAIFSGDPERPFLESAPLSPAYRDYILGWLTGRDIGQGVEWHSHFALDRETLPAFEQKALAILNEHLLSIRLRAGGCRLIDVNWLATVLNRETGEVAWETPWRRQLAERQWDALIPNP
jgi:hypothetical protein